MPPLDHKKKSLINILSVTDITSKMSKLYWANPVRALGAMVLRLDVGGGPDSCVWGGGGGVGYR